MGFNKNGYAVPDAQTQEIFTTKVREFSKSTCEEYGLTRVNTGDAWEIVRARGYDNLCARMAINNGVGDYYHDGDIGGGQYLNACVWFEKITGQGCIGNDYRPGDYTLSEDFIVTLQQAAHQAMESPTE